MKEKTAKISLAIAFLALCLSLASLAFSVSSKEQNVLNEQMPGDVQYVLYLGTNDKDTNQPVFTPDESKDILKEILLSHMGGYTIQEANGGWIDENGTEYQEYTLVIHLSDTTLEEVYALSDVLLDRYNQASILIQTNESKTEFYSHSSAAN